MDMHVSGSRQEPKQIRIGYLDDSLNGDVYSEILEGMLAAARREQVQLIRFGYDPEAFEGIHEETDTASGAASGDGFHPLLSLIREAGLDGLVFLGWTRAGAMYNRPQFLSLMGSLPLLSLGSEFPDIPHVMYRGDLHIEQVVQHLIHRHGYRRIAYMPPERPDTRIDAWRRVLRAHGLLFPELEIPDMAWGVSGPVERARRLLEILLDERQVALDAIVSSGYLETEALAGALEQRHLRIPEDIALTGYVDTDFERYADPGITTIDYPWQEMGEEACRQMTDWIRTGNRPDNVILQGRMLIRGSCGCVSELVHAAAAGQKMAGETLLSGMRDDDRARIVLRLAEEFPYAALDFDALLEALAEDLRSRQGNGFLDMLAKQLHSASASTRQARLETLVMRIRSAIMPWIPREPALLRLSGNLFRQAQHLLLGAIAQSRGRASLHMRNNLQALQETNQALTMAHTLPQALQALTDHLPKLGIPLAGMVLENHGLPTVLRLDIVSRKVETLPFASTRRILDDMVCGASGCGFLQVLPLMMPQEAGLSGQETHASTGRGTWKGYVLFAPGPVDEQIYRAIASHLRTALENEGLLRQLQWSQERLISRAYREGAQDVAAAVVRHAGGAFGSVSLSVQALAAEIRRSPNTDLRRMLQLLESRLCLEDSLREDHDDGNRAVIEDPSALRQRELYGMLGHHAMRHLDAMRTLVRRLQARVRHMEEMIALRQEQLLPPTDGEMACEEGHALKEEAGLDGALQVEEEAGLEGALQVEEQAGLDGALHVEEQTVSSREGGCT